MDAKFYYPHALADGDHRIRIMEKMLEFSSTVLSTLSLYLLIYTKVKKVVNKCPVAYSPSGSGQQDKAPKIQRDTGMCRDFIKQFAQNNELTTKTVWAGSTRLMAQR